MWQTDYPVIRSVHHQLHDRVFFAFTQCELQRREDRLVDTNVLAAVPRFFFGETHCCELRLAEHGSWDVRVVDAVLASAVETMREVHPLGDRNRTELDVIDDVADGMNRWHRAREIIVDDDSPALPELDTDLFEPQSFRVRLPPDRKHRKVGFEDFAVVELRFEARVGFAERLHLSFRA